MDYLLGRRCPSCGQPRSLRNWIIVIAMALASAWIWIRPPARLGYWLGILILFYFAIVFIIDVEHRLILHPTSIAGALLGLGLGWFSHGLVATLIGGLGGFLIMFILYAMGWIFSRFRARRLQAAGYAADDEEALGQGDVILSTVLGFLLGWPLIWFGLLLAILLGGAFGIVLMIAMLAFRRYRKNALMVFMPYGPFLILSASFIIYFPHWLATVVPK
jgi:leader peptidase (prepilin peptidase)/N-methyltransferase